MLFRMIRHTLLATALIAGLAAGYQAYAAEDGGAAAWELQ